MEFKNIELKDKEWILPLLGKSGFRGSEYSFGNNYIWQYSYNIQISKYKDFYIVKSGKDENQSFLFPSGFGDYKEVFDEIKNFCISNQLKMRFVGVNKYGLEVLNQIYENVEVTENRNTSDYIYNIDDLLYLSGKKYHSKRNHINRFKENDWSIENITTDNIDSCKEMNKQWCIINECYNDHSLQSESCAVATGLERFFDIGFIGAILKVNGNITAFTFGELLSVDTFIVHVEKAMPDFNGSYPVINNEFVRIIKENFESVKYINREEDLGYENLRKAKLSYHPVFLEEKYDVIIIL